MSATVSGGREVSAPTPQLLTIRDDDAEPSVTLELSPSSISENGGAADGIAFLSGPSSHDVVLTLLAIPVSPAVGDDFTITSNTTLTIEARSTESAGTVTITGVDNGVDEPDKSVTLSATVSQGRGVSAPSSQTLTITDDDATLTVTLELSPPSISENGGAASVTASLSGPSSQDVILAVSAIPVSPAVGGDFTITSSITLTIAAGSTNSTGVVTIKGVDNSVYEPGKSVTVSASVDGRDVSAPSSQTLAITDDEATPLTLVLSTASISENGGAANVTASLSGPASQDVVLTLSVIPVSPAVSGDFTITGNGTLTIAAGSTDSTGTVTISGVDKSVHEPDKSVTVSANVSQGRGVSAPSSQPLTITDDDATPTVMLALSSASIRENGGVASVTASLSSPSSQDVTLVVSASAEQPEVSDDFTISSNKTLTIAAGSTRSRGVVTITGVDNSADEPDRSVTVAATVSGGHDVSAPSGQALAITDDDATPTVSLVLSAFSISENGGVANVTASLSNPSLQDVVVAVSASPVSPAVSGDFTISPNTTLIIAAGSTDSTGTVTITGVDNSVDEPHKSVTVEATATGYEVNAPASRTLTVTDDDAAPEVTLVLSSSSISENGGSANVTASLRSPSSQNVVLTISAIPLSPAVIGDLTITSNKTLTIEAGFTDSTGTVTITGPLTTAWTSRTSLSRWWLPSAKVVE